MRGPCGTLAGWNAHQVAGTTICEPCQRGRLVARYGRDAADICRLFEMLGIDPVRTRPQIPRDQRMSGA